MPKSASSVYVLMRVGVSVVDLCGSWWHPLSRHQSHMGWRFGCCWLPLGSDTSKCCNASDNRLNCRSGDEADDLTGQGFKGWVRVKAYRQKIIIIKEAGCRPWQKEGLTCRGKAFYQGFVWLPSASEMSLSVFISHHQSVSESKWGCGRMLRPRGQLATYYARHPPSTLHPPNQ